MRHDWLRASLARAFSAALLVGTIGAQDLPRTTVTGRLVDRDGAPIAGAGFATGRLDRLRTLDALESAETRSAKDGTFTVVVTATVDDLRMSASGFLVAAPGFAAVRHGVTMAPWKREGTVTDGSEHLGDLVLEPGRDLHGSVRTGNGAPLEGALVRAVELVQLDRLFAFQTARYSAVVSGLGGRFRLPCVPRDCALAVLASADGHFDVVEPGVDPGLAVDLELVPSGHATGTLTDAGGRPVAGGHVFLDYGHYLPGFL